jgi:hypothetical protein
MIAPSPLLSQWLRWRGRARWFSTRRMPSIFPGHGRPMRIAVASCKIKARKDNGESVIIIAGCATDIMLSNVGFNLKALEPNKISRMFPGMPEMEINYYRCPI